MSAKSLPTIVRTVELFRERESGICHSIRVPFGELVGYTNKAPYKDEAPNEDNLAVFEVDQENCLLVVADGVGGSPAGAAASQLVIDKLATYLADPPLPVAIPALVITALEDAHEEIRARGSGSASTVALAHVGMDMFRPAHAGDSVVMACGQRGKLKFETIAHSPVGYALESGILSEDEAFTHEDRHVVSNIVGGQDIHITLGGSVNLSKWDTLLLATDGVTDNLRQSEIIDTIRRGPLLKCGETLAQMVVDRMETNTGGKPDDVTFILFRRTRQK
ncbi:MAG: PP2C family serine/threonine-protein phosphatase [Pseudomonadales bacterium]